MLRKLNRILPILLLLAMIMPSMVNANDLAVLGEDSSLDLIRLSGANRIETSIEASREVYPEGSDKVVLVGYDGEVDALTGTILAHVKDAPLLFIRNRSKDLVKEELERLGAKNIYILGGGATVNEDLEKELKEDYKVKRITGANRSATAVAIAEEVSLDTSHVLLANDGKDGELADALAVGPGSAINNMPLLLTKKDRLSEASRKAIDELNVKRVTIIGGSNAVSQDIEDQLVDKLGKDKVDRISGKNRYGTAIAIAEEFFHQPKNAIITNDGKVSYADAVIGGYIAAKNNSPLLLTEVKNLKDITRQYIENYIYKGYVIGGNTVVSEDVRKEIVEILDVDTSLPPPAVIKKSIRYHTTRYQDSLERALDKQVGKNTISRGGEWVAAKRYEIERYLNPENFLQFRADKGNSGIVTADVLNVRKGPGTAYDVIGQTGKGEVHKLFSESNGWYKIDYKGKEGWISSTYLDLKNYLTSVEITINSLNVRKRPNTSSSILTRVSNGSIYIVLDEKDGWYKINSDGKIGWISGNYTRYVNDVPRDMYQFMILSGQAGATLDEINSELLGKGILEGQGKAFIEGSKKYNINELYLLSHAFLETGNGRSLLANGLKIDANGKVVDKSGYLLDKDGKIKEEEGKKIKGEEPYSKTVYNMFGIGAVDSDPLRAGAQRALDESWFSPEAAIREGAHWISKNYINNPTYKQDTLYKMKYNPSRPGVHQYATDIAWAHKQRNQIDNMMDLYKSMENVTLRFDIPIYK